MEAIVKLDVVQDSSLEIHVVLLDSTNFTKEIPFNYSLKLCSLILGLL